MSYLFPPRRLMARFRSDEPIELFRETPTRHLHTKAQDSLTAGMIAHNLEVEAKDWVWWVAAPFKETP